MLLRLSSPFHPVSHSKKPRLAKVTIASAAFLLTLALYHCPPLHFRDVESRQESTTLHQFKLAWKVAVSCNNNTDQFCDVPEPAGNHIGPSPQQLDG
jgi:hypothetical protein